MKKNIDILIVDDDINLASNLQDILKEEGYATALANNGQSALTLCHSKIFDISLVDIKLPDMSGMDLIMKLTEVSPSTEYIIMTGHPSLESAVGAVRQKLIGAYEIKPLNIKKILVQIEQIIKHKYVEEQKLKSAVSDASAKEAEVQRKKLEDYIDIISDAVMILNLKYNIILINSAFEKLIGQRRNDIIGKPGTIIGFESNKDKRDLIKIFKEVEKNGSIKNIEITVIIKDDKEISLLLSAKLIKDAQNKPTGIIFVLNNVTELKDAKEKIKYFTDSIAWTIDETAFSNMINLIT
jgi:PAS domain S-box-containing protein